MISAVAESVKGAANGGDARKVDGRSTRWDRHRRERRAELVGAAVRAVERHGPDVLTDQIAEEAGVPRPRLYRYFEGRADLELAISVRATEMFTAEFAPLWPPAGAPAKVIEDGLTGWVRWVAAHADLYRFVRGLDGADQRDRPGSYAHAKETITTVVIDLLRAQYARVGADPAEIGALTTGLFGLVEAATVRWLDAPDGLTADDLAARLVRWTLAVVTDTAAHHGLTLDPYRPLPPAEPGAPSTEE